MYFVYLKKKSKKEINSPNHVANREKSVSVGFSVISAIIFHLIYYWKNSAPLLVYLRRLVEHHVHVSFLLVFMSFFPLK